MPTLIHPSSSVWKDEAPEIEARLQDTFRPINPSRDFINDLQHRLMRKPEMAVFSPNDELIKYILIVLTSVVSSILIAVLLAKFIYLGSGFLRRLFRI